MVSNPDICECNSQLFLSIWAVSTQDDISNNELNPKEGNTHKKRVGFKCIECGKIQLTRKIPEQHSINDKLDLPESAYRDMVRES